MSSKRQTRADSDYSRIGRPATYIFVLGVLLFITSACGGSDAEPAVTASSAAPAAVAAAPALDEAEETQAEETQAADATDEEVTHSPAEDDDDNHADNGDDDDNHADDGDDGDDNDEHGDDDEQGDDDHAASGESISAAADGTPEIGTVVEQGAVVPEGTYVVNALGENFRLRIDKPVTLGTSEPGFFAFTTEELGGSRESRTLLAILQTVGIVPPREVGIHQGHDPAVPDATVDIPDDLVSWFDAVPQVLVVDSGSTTVAGEPAHWFRLTVDATAGPTFDCPYSEQCAGFVVMPTGVTVLAKELDVAVWQLDAVPGVMPWVQVTDPALFDTAQKAMIEMLDGLSAA